GFSRVHTDERMRRLMLLMQEHADRPANRKERAVVQRRCAGDTTNAVSTKILLSHKDRKEIGPLLEAATKSLAQHNYGTCNGERCARRETLLAAKSGGLAWCVIFGWLK